MPSLAVSEKVPRVPGVSNELQTAPYYGWSRSGPLRQPLLNSDYFALVSGWLFSPSQTKQSQKKNELKVFKSSAG